HAVLFGHRRAAPGPFRSSRALYRLPLLSAGGPASSFSSSLSCPLPARGPVRANCSATPLVGTSEKTGPGNRVVTLHELCIAFRFFHRNLHRLFRLHRHLLCRHAGRYERIAPL